MGGHEHDMRQQEVVEEHIGCRRVRPDDVFIARAQMARVQSRLQQMFQHFLRHTSHHRVPVRDQFRLHSMPADNVDHL